MYYLISGGLWMCTYSMMELRVMAYMAILIPVQEIRLMIAMLKSHGYYTPTIQPLDTPRALTCTMQHPQTPIERTLDKGKVWPHWGSNPRPLERTSSALTTELHGLGTKRLVIVDIMLK
jgi:hypothetical protein